MHELETRVKVFFTNGHHAKQDEFVNGCNCAFWKHSNRRKCFWKMKGKRKIDFFHECAVFENPTKKSHFVRNKEP